MKKWMGLIIVMAMIFSSFTVGFGDSEQVSIVKIGTAEEPDSFNPLVAYERGAFENFMLIYDSLYVFDENLEPSPNLATSYEVSEDQLVWTFHLRDDVKWHDGEAFTSEDVKFTFELIKSTELSLYYDYVADIESIDTPDDFTVILTTFEPKANMLQNVTPILPEHIWSALDADAYELFENEAPIGTGPFKFSEWKKNEYWSLTANKDYFKGAPNSDGLVFTVFANRDTMAQALKLAEIDVALGLYQNQVKTIQNDNLSVHNYIENGFTELAFNNWTDPESLGNPLILDKRIRQAIDYAIDKQKIIDMVYEGAGIAGTTLVPISQTGFHYELTSTEIRNYSKDAANKLLDEAGYLDKDGDGIREDNEGNPLSFVFLLRSDNTNEVKVGQMIKSYLVEIGIETVVETIDDGALNDRIYGNANFDMFIWGWGGDTDPGTILRILTTDQIWNLNDVFYSNETYDALVKAQATQLDVSERTETIYEAQRIIYDEVPYSILMYENELQIYRNDRITGITPTKAGAIFYADTPMNYISVKVVGDNVTSSGSDDSSSLPFITGGVIALFIVLISVVLKRKKSKKAW